MVGMRLSLALASLAVLSGCAHTLENREDRVVVAVDGKGSSTDTVTVTETPPVIIVEPVAARPRLSRTVTLGEGTTEPVYVTQPQVQQQGQGGGANVVVNNNITVVGSPSVVYGGYGGGYGRTYGTRDGYGGAPAPSQSRPGYPPSGWEGAGRTAAPGQTPHVGGNWAPPTSHGPRQFK
jgi:hypothetical protein